MYQNILTLAALFFCACTDIKYRRVYLRVVAAYVLLALAGHMAGHTATVEELALSLLPGALGLLLSWLSRQSLGYGDSALLLACGVSLKLWPCAAAAITAFFLAGLWAIGLLVFRRTGRAGEFAFVPFLFLGALLQCFIGG